MAYLPKIGGHAVQQMRGGKIAHHVAAPPFIFEQIIIQQYQHFVCGYVRALFVHNAQPVGVPVGRDAQQRMMIEHGRL